jgi:dTDP-4-amino-4,6-dideoxygalactose transaminase
LPELEKYVKYLRIIWRNNWLTNNGELVQELENKLEDWLGVKNVVCVSSGTSALMIALRCAGVKDKLYTSPYSFLPTVSAPTWMGYKLKFVDLDEAYKSPALVTHVYGIPNIVNAKKVIYDASHAFSVKYKGKSILSYGDVSIISFHAVKTFQTVEGGGIVTNNNEIADKARWMRNYGFKGRYSFHGAGINAKMSEFHAAMGLCSLEMINSTLVRYRHIIEKYNKELGYDHKDVTYYPIWYSSENKVKKAIKEFERHNIYPRRYFYPPLNEFFGGRKCPRAEDKMSRVLCLPLYYALRDEQVDSIVKIAKKTL